MVKVRLIIFHLGISVFIIYYLFSCLFLFNSWLILLINIILNQLVVSTSVSLLSFLFFAFFYWPRKNYGINFCICELVLDLKAETKSRSMSPLTHEANFTTELFDDLLGDTETKTDSFGVDIFCRLHEPKEFEQLWLVFFFDTQAIVFYLHFEVWLIVFLVKRVKDVDRTALLRKFDCIRLQIDKALLQPSFVSLNHDWRHLLNWVQLNFEVA